MPGLVGLVTKMPRERAEAELLRMVASLRHEQSYICGTWTDESLGLYVGWVARSGPHAQEMPLVNERGDLVLFFSGEDYREPNTVDLLRKRGHSLPADGPEYLVHLAEEDSEFPRILHLPTAPTVSLRVAPNPRSFGSPGDEAPGCPGSCIFRLRLG